MLEARIKALESVNVKQLREAEAQAEERITKLEAALNSEVRPGRVLGGGTKGWEGGGAQSGVGRNRFGEEEGCMMERPMGSGTGMPNARGLCGAAAAAGGIGAISQG